MRKAVLVMGAVAVFIVGTSVLLYAFGTRGSLPRGAQALYYKVAYSVSFADQRPTSAYMLELHRATRPEPADDRTPYTFSYTVDDVVVIEQDSLRCEACHGDMRQTKNGRPLYPIHVKMLTAPLIRFHCTDCHKTVDLGRRVPGRVTIRVDRTQCTKCHEAAAGSPVTKITGAPRIGKVDVPEIFLISNHGIDKASGKVWVTGKHARVAKAIGVKKCRRCHQKGSEFDFCGDCHGRRGLKGFAE